MHANFKFLQPVIDQVQRQQEIHYYKACCETEGCWLLYWLWFVFGLVLSITNTLRDNNPDLNTKALRRKNIQTASKAKSKTKQKKHVLFCF